MTTDHRKRARKRAQDLIEIESKKLVDLELREKFFQKKVLQKPNGKFGIPLGQIQSSIRAAKEWVEFLKEQT